MKMNITFDNGFNFWELSKDEFVQSLHDYGYDEGKLLADGSTVRRLLLIALYPDLSDSSTILAEGFDKAIVYSHYDYLASDGLAFLQLKEGETERYFGMGQEPSQLYVGPYDRERILQAAKRCDGEFDLDPEAVEAYLEDLEARPEFAPPDLVGIFISM